MKKLMTAFAACLIAGVVSAQVESLNIVGYQTLAGNEGFTVVAPTFVVVGGVAQECTFGAIQGGFQFFDQLQFFDAVGDVTFTAVWLDDSVGYTPGWYTDDWSTSLADQTIPAGSGFFAQMAVAGDIVIAGQVETGAIEITAGEGFTVIGNPRPYDITFGDLACTGVQFFDQLQFFDSVGDVSFTAVWLDDSVGYTPGWYTDDWSTSLATDVIAAGQGFFLQCAAAGATVTIPAPVL